jgi:uncharacterized membrane protein (UPF0127 family)
MKKVLVVIVLLLAAVAGGYFYWQSLPDPSIATMPKLNATLNNVTFSLYAPTDTEGLQKGLSIFDKLEPNEGMIFRGLPVGQQAFWMQDMKFDIDIIWVNKDNEVIHIVNDASKDSFPNQFKNPVDRPSAYVIELNAGMAEKHSIYPGTQVTIQQ